MISDDDLRRHVDDFLKSRGERRDVLIIPPDYTRYHSHAGTITRFVAEHYDYVPPRRRPPSDGEEEEEEDDGGVDDDDDDDDGDDGEGEAGSSIPPTPPTPPTPPEIKIMPALGTHQPMTPDQTRKMFGDGLADVYPSPFVVHDWREDVVS